MQNEAISLSKIDTQNISFNYQRYTRKERCRIGRGIYGIFYRDKCLYIGASKDCAKRANRIYSNPTKFSANDNVLLWAIYSQMSDDLHIHAFPIECDNKTLGRYEKAFIRKYKPALNHLGRAVYY